MCQTLLGKYHYFSCFIAYETEQLNYECFFLTIEKQRLKQGKLEGKGSSNSVIFFILSRVMFKHNKMKADFLGAVTLPMANIAKLGEQQAYQLTLVVKNPPANSGEARGVDLIPGSGGSLEQKMAARYSIPAWKIPWTVEPGRLQPMGSQRVGDD